ncbi:hypothetical protein D3C87_1595330 [compost metagenome]
MFAIIKYTPITKPDLSKIRNVCLKQIKDQVNEDTKRLQRVQTNKPTSPPTIKTKSHKYDHEVGAVSDLFIFEQPRN